ncbi:hypothetical protein OESDEN_03500 [Oesophagostomum dentatum]|uniref:Uncharacterized protein n=1 Tax=Oesophagostomum dentatum TaxID=61180 RepID=A0A0B1TL45_OESDE|nr:hypothetical protein OESDEN_03500 [Oesophagostomum dentatum]
MTTVIKENYENEMICFRSDQNGDSLRWLWIGCVFTYFRCSSPFLLVVSLYRTFSLDCRTILADSYVELKNKDVIILSDLAFSLN